MVTSVRLDPSGLVPDISWVDGSWYVAAQVGTGEDCRLSIWRDGIWLWSTPLDDGTLAFPRLCVNYLAYRDGNRLIVDTVDLEDTQPYPVVTTVSGNDPVALSPLWVAWQQGPTFEVYRMALNATLGVWQFRGAPTGLSRILEDGTVRLVDWDRLQSTPLGTETRPCWADDGVMVVERADGGVSVWTNARERYLCLWPGTVTFTPRIARCADGRYAVVTWGLAGLRVAIFTADDLQPFVPSVPVPDPPPVEPPPMPTVPFSSFRWSDCTVYRDASDIGSWPMTSQVTAASTVGSTVRIEHTKAGQWPVVPYENIVVEGCIWTVGYIDGHWRTATWDRLRPGQTEKAMGAAEYQAAYALNAPGWEPQPGEVVGYLVSTPARFDERGPVNERSPIVWVTYGTDTVVGREGTVIPPPVDPPPVEPPPTDLEARVSLLERSLRNVRAALGDL